jgi:DNA polymerase-1
MKIVIIDSFALIHRVYHALPNLTTSSGEPSGAVYGFCRMLLKVLEKFSPDRVYAAFDEATRPTFRKELAPDYHANRPEKDQAMIDQIPVIKDFLSVMKIPVYVAPGFEGDDIIGTLARELSSRPNAEILILTGDYDTLQLVNQTTKVFTMRKGITDTVLFDEAAVKEKYGFFSEYLPDYKALMGDPSDNYPGVPGIGPKTAQKLIQQFQTLENLYAQLESKAGKNIKTEAIPEPLKQKLLANKNQAFLSKKLSLIRRDVPLDIDYDLSKSQPVQVTSEAREFFEKMGFASLIKYLDNQNQLQKPSIKERSKSVTKQTLRLF